MASLCNLPSFSFSISLPALPGFPSIDLSFSLAFTLPGCPLD